MLLHEVRNDDGIKNFFQEVHELYVKVNRGELLYSRRDRFLFTSP